MYTYRLSLLRVMLNYCHSCCRLFDLSELANLFLYAVKNKCSKLRRNYCKRNPNSIQVTTNDDIKYLTVNSSPHTAFNDRILSTIQGCFQQERVMFLERSNIR